MKKREIIFGLIVGLLGILLAVGAQTFAQPCAHADGMGCTQSKNWLTVIGGAIAVCAGVSVLKPNPVTQILAAVGGLAAILTPGVFVKLCMVETMPCQMYTRPFALVIGILIGLLSLCWLVADLTAKKREAQS